MGADFRQSGRGHRRHRAVHDRRRSRRHRTEGSRGCAARESGAAEARFGPVRQDVRSSAVDDGPPARARSHIRACQPRIHAIDRASQSDRQASARSLARGRRAGVRRPSGPRLFDRRAFRRQRSRSQPAADARSAAGKAVPGLRLSTADRCAGPSDRHLRRSDRCDRTQARRRAARRAEPRA